VANWIKTPNFWTEHCYNCKHAHYTEQLEMRYPGSGISQAKSLYTNWPVGKCALHGEYVFSFLKCPDYQERA